MRSAKSDPRRGGGWRRGVRVGTIELLNAHWHKLRGGSSAHSCPVCDAKVSAGDDAVHQGGELYHFDCGTS
jgi:hypothetical protein